MDNNAIIKHHPDVMFNEIDGEVVLMHIESGQYFNLNTIGSEIWGLLESGIRYSDLLKKLLEVFDVSEEECRQQTDDYLKTLKEIDVIIIEAD